MSASPLVYLSKGAQANARRLLPGEVVVENRVADAIASGHVFYGKTIRALLGDGVVAVVRRVPGRLRGRPRAWEVVELKSDSRRRPADGTQTAQAVD